MTHDRDLFRAIVLSGVAVVGGCATPAPAVDASTQNDATAADAGGEDAMVVADGSHADASNEPDAPPHFDSGMVLIL
jgi:hypothetical protein